MLMTRDSADPLVGPLSDLDDTGHPSQSIHSPTQFHNQHQGVGPALYAQQQHASASQYQHIGAHYHADIFSTSPPRGVPTQAMYASQDGMPHPVQEEHQMPMGGAASMGMSRYHGVTCTKGKWQASVFSHGRCGTPACFPTAFLDVALLLAHRGSAAVCASKLQ
jgi:hypothetical protein